MRAATKLLTTFLDRPGLRPLLGILATRRCRRETASPVRVFYDTVWIHSSWGTSFFGGHRFARLRGDQIALRFEERLERLRHLWYQFYKPTPGDIILDCGAGLGHDTVLFSQSVGDHGKVYSIEAHPVTFRTLEKQIASFGCRNALAFNIAIADSPGRALITDLPDDEENYLSAGGLHEGRGYDIEAVRLDDFVEQNRIERIDYLKMNIEGGERAAIQGMQKTIRLCRFVTIACHDFLLPRFGPQVCTLTPVATFLEDNGFLILNRDQLNSNDALGCHVHASRL